jgi:AraC family transcriptional regulator, transcriptional activator of pobA
MVEPVHASSSRDYRDREDAGSIPFKSYALERDTGPRFHIRRVENTQRIYPAHKHDYFQILCYLTEAPSLRVGLTSHKPQPGSIYFVAPMVPHQIRFDQATRCVVIYFDLDFLRPGTRRFYPITELIRLAPELTPFAWQNQVNFNLDRPRLDRLERSIASMIGQFEAAATYALEVIRAELALMLALLCQDYGAEFTSLHARLPIMGRDSAHMRRIAEFVGENYTRGPSLSEAAKAARLSKSRLCALIREYTGSTFNTLIRELRMDEARERLVLTDETITQIAYRVGYNDEKYFLRAFKKSSGVTPSAYRVKRAQTEAAGKLASAAESNPAKHSSSADGNTRTELTGSDVAVRILSS